MYKVFTTAKNILYVEEILNQLEARHYGLNTTVRVSSPNWVTINGFNYTLGNAAIVADMKLVALDENQISKVTYNPNVLDLTTACVMAECLYGVPAVSGDEPGTLILNPMKG